MKTKRKIYLGKTADSRTRKRKSTSEGQEPSGALFTRYKDFTAYLLQRGYSSSSTQRNIIEADRFLQWVDAEGIEDVSSVTYNDVMSYIQQMKGVKNRTKELYLRGVKQYFDFLISKDVVSENPVAYIRIHGIKRKTLYHILSAQELDKLYHEHHVPDEVNDRNKNQNWFRQSVLAARRNKVILGMMVYQGMNTLDLSRLRMEDIKLREGKVFIERSRRSNERLLSLQAHQVMDIMEYQLKVRAELMALSGKQSDLFFVSTGSSERFNNVINRLISILRKVNRKVHCAKQIRASVITHWLKLYNLREVQYMAGHRFVSSTEGYLINDLDDLKEEITKYHPIG